jgi:uncharacterized protein with PQ loop repeat
VSYSKLIGCQIILAIYYTIADIVLLGQCFYYRGFTFRDPRPDKITSVEDPSVSERTPLVANGHAINEPRHLSAADADLPRNRSASSFREHFASLNGTHLSPATPMHPQKPDSSDKDAPKPSQPRSWLQAIAFNSTAIILVVIAGIAGYYLSPSAPETKTDHHGRTEADDQVSSLHFNLWGQVFGYICAVLYLGSRLPQLLLNYRRKSTEGLNALFFLFACIGNLTYVMSIFAFEPICSKHYHGHWHESHCKSGEASAVYGRYILVNLSWLVGSLGTLVLDMGVFAQFFLYRDNVGPDSSLPADALPRTIDGEGRGREPNER